MDVKDPLVLIFTRNAFYKRMHYLALGLFGLCLLVVIALLCLLVFIFKNPSPSIYFPTDKVGRLIRVPPVNVPYFKTEEVAQWATKAIEAAFSYNYVNYRQQLQDAQKYFTHFGWEMYMKTLTASNNLLAIKERKMVAVAHATMAPRLLKEGKLGNAYGWQFEVPILLTYQQPPYDDNSLFYNNLNVTVLIRREQIQEGDQGLGIVKIIGAAPKIENETGS
ncbi:MAG TPA: DotI/IcmL/TraM family protein [Gammaproteobacteria bacterium]|jgi:intracellular multiplication protein IcmL|nr:DotI/IcmL/TraM family protein [Gammaproteobacteria bacterium]